MAQSTSSSPKSSRNRTGRRLNRSEQRAMEIRAAKSVNVLQRSAAPGVPVTGANTATTPRTPATLSRPVAVRRARSGRARAVHPVVLTREQEYAFIRHDLRQMLILSGVLILGMIAVLFVLEAL